MKIQNIKLENFAGVKSAEYKLNGREAVITGENDLGKSTIFDSLVYLLTDKNSTLDKGWTPKTRDIDGAEKHHLNHTVEITFDVDGNPSTLSKVYHETYKKKRGSNSEEFSGHTTDYFVDDVPTKESDFEKTVLELTGAESTEQILSTIIPNYFAKEMTWQDRRKVLLDIVGDIEFDDVINANKELTDLENYVNKNEDGSARYSVDELKEIAKAKRKKINKELEEIPARIDEVERSKPEVSVKNETEVKNSIKSNKKSLTEIENKIDEAKATDGQSEILAQKIEIKNKIANIKDKLREESSKKREAFENKQSELQSKVSEESQKVSDLEYEISKLSQELLDKRETRDLLAKKFRDISNMQWDESNEICPVCNRKLEQSDIDQAKATFNERKSNQLDEINAIGKEVSKTVIADLEAELNAKENELAKAESSLDQVKKNLEQFIQNNNQDQLNEGYDSNPEIKELEQQLEKLNKTTKTVDIKGLEVEKNAIEQSLSLLNSELNKFELIAQLNERIKALKAQEKKLSSAFLETEKVLDLVDEYTRTLVSLLDEKINSKFKNVKFQLFEEQVNGGIKEICEVLVPSRDGSDVPFANANTGGKMLAGFEIVNTLQKHYGLNLPVFIDNFESLSTTLPKHEMQVIYLQVVKGQKKLNVTLV